MGAGNRSRFWKMKHKTLAYTVKDTSEPSAEPVDLAFIKAHARIDISATDDAVELYITAARERLEEMLNVVCLNHTVRMVFDCFDRDVVKLPRAPLVSVDNVNYIDTDGVQQVVPLSVYGVDLYSEPGGIFLLDGQDWPETREQPGAVWVDFTAGYDAADVTKVPKKFRQWIAIVAAAQFNDPEDFSIANAKVSHLKGKMNVMPL